jgi:CSLREA domain-containing protein
MKSKSKMPKVFVGSLILIALVLLLSPRPGGAQTAIFIVNSTADSVDANPGDGVCADGSGVCTLRAAIMEANALPGADTIAFAPSVFNAPKTITLSIPGGNEEFNVTGDLDINSDLTITGAGANMIIIDGGGIDRVLDISPVNTTNVSISGLTVTGGKTLNISPGGGNGGGIRNQATLLTLTNVTVDDNEADYGGGIFVGGPVTLNNCTVSGNTALAGGGGIINYINGPLILNNSTVSGNTGGFAGGIVASNYGNTLYLNNSTVSGNPGGGLHQQAGTVVIKNTILADNGGRNCSFPGNSPGGGLSSLGHNLSTDNSCTPSSIVRPGVTSGGLDQPTDFNNTPALLAPLALNAPGSTKTHALLPVSPAIDAGGPDCSPTDQRGVPRPQGAACDIGAYEVGTAPTGPCVSPPLGLKAWWPLDETTGASAADIVGGHNGTALPGPIGAFAGSGPVTSASWPPPSFPPGKVGTSLYFDGSRRVEVPHNSALEPGTGDFTIDAWVIYAASGNGQELTVAQKNTGATAAFGNTFDGWRFVIRDSSPTQGRLSFRGPLSLGGSVEELITPNTWHHVAATLSTTNGFRIVKNYVDGVSSSQIGLNGDIASTAPLLIGGDGINAGQIAVDELEIFNRDLTQSEIQAIFNAGSAGKCKCAPPPSGLVGWWPGDNHPNDIRNGNHGTLVGGASYAPGKVNQAFSFPSLSSTGSDRVGLTSAPSANTFTIEAWVFANQHGPSAYRTIYADDFRGFWLKSGKLNWWRGGDRFIGTTTVPLGAWHHIALTYSQGTFIGYLNGVAIGTSFFPGESLPTGTGLGIGGHSGFVAEDFDGLIDELAVYDRALDPAEILAIFNAGSGGTCLPQPCPPTITCPADVVVDNSNHPGHCSAVVNYTVSATASCSNVTVACSPPSGSVFPKGTTTVSCAATNSDGTAACSFTVTVIPPQLTALSPAKVWIGLKTSDDVGTKFDLLAEVLKNGTVVGTGQLNGVPGGSSGFNNAVLNPITLALSSLPVDICAGDALAFKLSIRVAANSGHSSGTARLWYNGNPFDTGSNRNAGSRFNATIGGGTANYFLRTGVLNTTAGSSKTFIDVLVNRKVGGNPFKLFGIWSITF